MNIIAFMNQKGGVGKTTSAVNIGSILAAEYGRKVLLLDLDPQGNLSDHVGIYPAEDAKSIYNVLIDGVDPRTVLQHVHGMDVLPANIDLSAAEVELVSMMNREFRLKKAVSGLCAEYDYVLLDCPPSLGLLTICGLTLAQSVIVPMEAEYLALKGLSQLTNTLKLVADNLNPDLTLGGVLFCMYTGNTLLAKNVKNEVEQYFPGKVFENFIRRNVRLAESPSHGMPVNLYDPGCAGSEDYREVTAELIARFEGEDAKKKIAAPLTAAAASPDLPIDPDENAADAECSFGSTESTDADTAETGITGLTEHTVNPETELNTDSAADDSAAAACPPEPPLFTAPAPEAGAAEKTADAQTPQTVSLPSIVSNLVYRRHAAAPRKPFVDLPPCWKGDGE